MNILICFVFLISNFMRCNYYYLYCIHIKFQEFRGPGIRSKWDSPAILVMQALRHFYFVRGSYGFLLGHGSQWKIPFCVISIVFGGDRGALEFVEKSLDIGMME